jgi:hypothetical protein
VLSQSGMIQKPVDSISEPHSLVIAQMH